MTVELSRRSMIQSLCGGLGSIGLNAMLGGHAQAASVGRYKGPSRPVKAKHVIFLFMTGGPSRFAPGRDGRQVTRPLPMA